MSDPVHISDTVWKRINQDAEEAKRIVDQRFASLERTEAAESVTEPQSEGRPATYSIAACVAPANAERSIR